MTEKSSPRFYGRRKGRPLRKQRTRLMKELLPQVLIRDPASLDLSRETWFEIGFGGGEHLAEIAEKKPDIQLIGCEVFENGIASLLQHIEEKNLRNIRIYPEDARSFLKNFPSACVSKILIMFPDPWPKKKHHKRRLVNSAFLHDILRIMRPSAEFRFASDHEDYVQEVFDLLQEKGSFSCIKVSNVKPADWPLTSYNQKAVQSGTARWYLKTITGDT